MSLAALAVIGSFLACGGDGPTASKQLLDLSRSTLTVAPAPYVSGQTYAATLAARDSKGDPYTRPATVAFSLSGGTSTGTFGAVANDGNGGYSTTFGALTAGTAATLSVSVDNVQIPVGARPQITVVPGPISLGQSSLAVGAPTLASGSLTALTLTARDAQGNVVPAAAPAVVFTKGSGTSDGTIGAATNNLNGTFTANFTATTTGSARTIGAMVDGAAVTSALPTITVTAGPASPALSTLSVSATGIASGSQGTVTLTVRDAQGNVRAVPTDVVVFTKGVGTSDFGPLTTTNNLDGTHSATYVGTTAGTPRAIGATINGVPVTSATPTVQVMPGAASVAQSLVTVSAATLASGSTAMLTLAARDAAGNALATGGAFVLFTKGTGGTSDGTIGAVTDNTDGTYTASFDGTLAGTARAIGATLEGVPVTTTQPTITVVPGAVSVVQSTLAVGAPSVAAGSGTVLTLTVRDGAGNVRAAGGDAVVFGLGGGTSGGTISATTDSANGSYSATFTGTVVGSPRSIGATINGATVMSASPMITVTPGTMSPTLSTVAASAPSVPSGSSATLTLTVRDAEGNVRTAGGDSVVFEKGAGSSDGTLAAATDNRDGTYTATFLAVNVGSPRAFGATINGIAVTSASPTITVTPGALSLAQSAVTVSAASVASGGAVTLTLTARDAAANRLTTGGRTVLFTKGSGTSDGTIAATADNGDGTYSAALTATTAGSARTLGATVDGAAVTSATPTLIVTPGPTSLAQSTVSLSAAIVETGDSVTLTLTVRDAAGNALTTGGRTVLFTKGTGTSDGTIGAVTDNGDGTYAARFIGSVAGTPRAIGATIDGQPVTSARPTLSVQPGGVSLALSTVTTAASSLVSGDSTTVTLTARDAQSNVLTSGGLAVLFTTGAGTSDGFISATTDNANGTYTAIFTATTAGTPRTIGATISGNAITSTGPTITVTPGAVSLAQSLVSASASTVASGDALTFTLTARDAAGNLLASGGLTVTFTKAGGTSDGTFGSVSDNANGTYTASFTGTTTGTARTIGATIGGSPVTSASPTVTVTPGTASPLTSTLTASTTTIASGSTATLTVTLRDAAGNVRAAGGNSVVLTKGAGTSDGTISAVSDNGDGTFAATFTGTTAGTARTINAAVDGQSLTSVLPALTVTVGALSLAQSAVAVAAPTVASGSAVAVTLTARDAAGNALTSGGLTVAFTFGAGTSTGTLSSTTDIGDGTYVATFTGTVVGTPRQILALIGGSAVTSAAPTVSVTPGPLALALSTLTVSTSSVGAGGEATLTLTTRDAAGNALTSGGRSVLITKGTGTSDGSISAVTDNADGTYAATLTATTVGTARELGATIDGQAITSTLPSVTVTAGAVSRAQSLVTVSTATLTSGATAVVTLTARDALGNALPGGGLAVLFTKGAGSSDGTLSETADNGDGTYTATFMGTVAGTARTIGATIAGDAVTSTLPTITVMPGALSLAQSTVTVSAPSLASGNTVTLTLTARDAAGNGISAGGATVLFPKGSGTSDGAIGVTNDNGDGTYTATFTGTTAGSPRVIGATVDAAPVTSASPTLTVTPGVVSLAQSVVSVSAPSVASGSAVTATLAARDAAGNALSGGGLTVDFVLGAGSGGGTLSATTDNGDGTYTASFTGTTVGSGRAIGATIDGNALTSAAPTVAVTPGAVSLATSTVAVSVASVASGTDATLTLTARDAAGNARDSGGLVVLFTKGSGTSDGMISATTDNGDGTYNATFTGTIAGSARAIGATIGGNAITGAAPSITVTPGALSLATSSVTTSSDTVTSGVEVALTLTTRDAAGNALSAGGRTVLFTKGAGSSDGTISATTDNANGTYTATFTGTTAGTARALGATVDGNALTSAAPTVMVKPGALSLAQSSVAVSASSIASGTGTTLTLTTRDAAGNTFTSGGLAVLFSKGSGTSEGTISAATDNSNGTYTATFTATTAGTARAIGATVEGNAVTSAAPTITVTPGAIAVGTSTVSAGATTLVIGTTTTVTLTAFDAAGNRITAGGASVEFGLGSGSSTGTFSTVSNVGNGTYTAVFTATGSGTARQVTATIGAVAVTTTLPTITVTAPLMALSTDSVTINAQIETAAASQLLTVASIAGGTIGGLNTLVTALPGGPSNCASVNWLATPTFDMGGVASPVSLMTLQASAVGLALGSCAREVIVGSTTSDVISRRVVVVLNVGRSPAAAGVVSVVMMGDANNPSAQLISPTPVLTISNGGRGTINNVAAQILSQRLQTNSCSDTVPPCDPWLAPADLVLSSTTLPVTLSIIATARPFGASAIVRITGNGMTARDFEINVRFNQEPEMVTNPRNLVLRARLGGPVVRDSVLAFNQNQAHPGLESYRLDPGAPALPSWMTVQFVQQIGNSARVRILADPTAFARDTVITDTLGIRLLADFPDTSLVVTLIPKRYRLPYTLIVERGLSLSVANATLFAPVGTTAGTLDLLASHEGAGEVGGLQVTVQSGAPWLSAAFVGGVTATPATLRLTGDPTGITAGTYTSSVTVTSGSGATLQSRTIPVRLTVY